jgi:hypothetical protein
VIALLLLAAQELNDKSFERLSRFAFVDFVHGQTADYPADAVEAASLTVEIEKGDKKELVTMTLSGVSRTKERGRWAVAEDGAEVETERGYDAALFGRAVYDGKAGRFVAFELVAVGERHALQLPPRPLARAAGLRRDPLGQGAGRAGVPRRVRLVASFHEGSGCPRSDVPSPKSLAREDFGLETWVLGRRHPL